MPKHFPQAIPKPAPSHSSISIPQPTLCVVLRERASPAQTLETTQTRHTLLTLALQGFTPEAFQRSILRLSLVKSLLQFPLPSNSRMLPLYGRSLQGLQRLRCI